MLGGMGNSIKTVVDKLRDPNLVRCVQESFGLRVFENGAQNETVDAHSSSSEGLKHRSGKNVKKNSSNGAILSLAVSAIKKKRTKRKPIASYVMDSPPSSPEAGTPPPEPADVDVETYPLLDLYFRFVTLVGYEPFFITFLPYMFWNTDIVIARHLCILWVVSVYIGGSAKNIFKWSRPSSPPAIRLEVNMKLEQEYGFPSSHSIIATVFSLYCLYSCYTRYDFFYPMIVISTLWTLSVSTSRVYLGVHTVMDVLGGSIIALVTVLVCTPYLHLIDSLMFSYKYFPPLAIGFSVLIMVVYPTANQWSMDRGDTAAIVGATLGLMMGCHYNGPHADDLATGPFPMTLPSSQEMGFHTLRFIVGVLLVFPARFIMKLLCFRLLPAIMPDQGILEVQKRPFVELPYKLITYSSIALTMSYICPIVFELCQISRI